MNCEISVSCLSFPRKQESRASRLQRLPPVLARGKLWTPAFAGVTTNNLMSHPPLWVGFSLSGSRLDLTRLRGDLAPGSGARQPVDDNPVGRCETLADDPQAIVGHRARTDDLLLDGAVLLHGHHYLARLIGHDGAIGDQDCDVLLRGRDADPPELPGGDEITRV